MVQVFRTSPTTAVGQRRRFERGPGVQCQVNGKEFKGIDQIRFDADGKIVDFEVMIRPFSGLQALGDEMATRLAPYLPCLRGQRDA